MSEAVKQFVEMTRQAYGALQAKARPVCTASFMAFRALMYGYRCPYCGGELVGKPGTEGVVYLHGDLGLTIDD